MSRVCVKNLPKYVTEDRLREFFSQKGEITDARLMRTRDGKSRQFGFIGYRTEHEAEESIKYFNNSYLDTCRITCEIASKVGDPNIPRTWSRHSVNKQDNGKEAEKDSGLDASKVGRKNVIEDDPKLQEFLQVTQSRIKSKLWENDMLIAPMADENGKVHERLNSATEHRERLVSVDHELSETAQIDHKHSDTHETKRSQDLAYDNVISDIDYFKSRMKKEWSESESSDDENNLKEAMDEAESLEESVEAHGKALFHNDAQGLVPSKDADANLLDVEKPFPSPKERGLEACRLFVRNLPYTATLEELEEYFSKVGNVSQVHLVVDKQTNRSKGIAFVLYMLPECATRALEELDGTSFQGRLLHVMPAQPKNPSGNHELLADDSKSQASKSFKQKREDERKAAEASGDTRAWNSFFMRHDTVVENIARIYGVSKGEFLDGEADNLAVRQALGQTQVVAMTKKAFANAGVNVESLEEFATGKTKHMKRSNHVLLVKNLPYASSEAELAKMFGKFGSLDKIIVPPTKTLALVVFLEPSEARAAFKGLAYRRYLDGPLYLEWAPVNVLSQSSTFDNKSGKGNAVVGEEDAKRVILEQTLEEILDVDVDPDRVESRSLFVKNLNFKTTEDTVRTHFSQHMKEGRILSVKVKKHLKNGKNVSMGFGFVEFDSMDIATNVATDLQGTVLDGHALILQLCQAKKDGRVQKKVDKDKSSTKLLVRNVAFEATEKDLRQLFSPFGQIKSLRLPMKFGNHRGFAFVEYVTKQEAQNALQALSSTHLYGRHLVLERAKEGESLEELRARTAAQFTDEQNGFQNPRKLKKRKFGSITE